MTGYGSDDTATTAGVLARRRAQRAAKAAGGVALVRAAYDAAREVERRHDVLDPSAASGTLDVLEQRIESGAHVAVAAGGAR